MAAYSLSVSLTLNHCHRSNDSSAAVRALVTVPHRTDEGDRGSRLTAGREGKHMLAITLVNLAIVFPAPCPP